MDLLDFFLWNEINEDEDLEWAKKHNKKRVENQSNDMSKVPDNLLNTDTKK